MLVRSSRALSGEMDGGRSRRIAANVAKLAGLLREALLVGRNPGRRLSSTMMMHGGHWGAPSVMAAFAGFVHDRESTANDERNDNNDACEGRVHLQPPC